MSEIERISSAMLHQERMEDDPSFDAPSPDTMPMAAPLLTPPSQLSSTDYRFLRAIDSLGDTKNRYTRLQTDRLAHIKNQFSDNSAAFTHHLQEVSDARQSSEQWRSLKKVSSSLLASLSLISGMAAVSTPATALVGGALITSGVLSIANLAMSEGKGWNQLAEMLSGGDTAMRERLQEFLPITCGLLAAGSSLAGSTYAIASHGLSLADKAGQMAQAAFSLFHASTTFGKGTSDATLQFSQADLTRSDSALHTTRTSLEMLNQNFETLSSHFEQLIRQAKRAVQSMVQTQHLT
jgi:hypothetical protein